MSSGCHSFCVICENEDLVVVNKPHDVPMDGDEHTVTVERWALLYRLNSSNITENKNGHLALNDRGKQPDGKKTVKFVHQLDYATSGVLCVAFSREMAARLSHCFEMRTAQKAYLAILCGILPTFRKENCEAGMSSSSSGVQFGSESPYANALRVVALDELPNADFIRRCISDASYDTDKAKYIHAANSGDGGHSNEAASFLLAIHLPVGYDDSDPGGFRMAVNGRDARESLTYMYVLQRGYMQHPTEKVILPVTKVILIPRTGRRHQLRVHCHALGFPILGDVTYDTVSSPPLGERTAEAREGSLTPVRECLVEATGSKVTTQANIWERMMLHAWRLSLPVSVELVRCGKERYMQKRTRRRVRLGLEVAEGETSAEWTHFVTEDPFAHHISESPLLSSLPSSATTITEGDGG